MMASMDAVEQKVPGAEVQHAQLLWAMNEPHRAILQLQEVSSWGIPMGIHSMHICMQQQCNVQGP